MCVRARLGGRSVVCGRDQCVVDPIQRLAVNWVSWVKVDVGALLGGVGSLFRGVTVAAGGGGGP